MDGSDVFLAIFLFVLTAIYDGLCVAYVRSAATGRGARAAACSIGIYLIGLVSYREAIANSFWFVLPECLGFAVGTMVGVQLTQSHD
jgi:hypothetical protein